MKRQIWIFLLWSMASGAAEAKGRVPYPRVADIQGDVAQISTEVRIVKKEPQTKELRKALKKTSVFKDRALIETGEKSLLRLQLSPHATLVIKENSLVELPGIEWKDGSVKEILLKRGSIRYLCQEIQSEKCERFLKTGLQESQPPAGDYILQYAPRVPEVSLTVLRGTLDFSGIGNESSVVLHEGERASFRGELENESPAVDVLLHGKKAVKGHASAVTQVPEKEIQILAAEEALHQKKMKAKPISRRRADQICDKPWGQFNQCAWVCENNPKKSKICDLQKGAQCVRQRCSADGEWVDRQTLSSSQSTCEVKPIVSACDY